MGTRSPFTPGRGDPDEAVDVASFRYRHEAELAQGYLEDAGVPAVVLGGAADEIQFGKGFSARSRLLVRRRDRTRARAVLRRVGIVEP